MTELDQSVSSSDVVLWCADVVLPLDQNEGAERAVDRRAIENGAIENGVIENGAVAVVDGRIVGLGSQADLRAEHPNALVNQHGGILMPGLVNAHTHLQYTTFAAMGHTPFEDYTAWSVRFVEEYDARPGEDWVAACHAGVDLSLAAGVTCIADIVTDFEARDVLFQREIPGVAYLELIGTVPADWEAGDGARLADAVRTGPTTEATSVGISPHAPYSIEMPVLRAMANLARELGVRLHTHVGESDGEDEFYRTGTGSLAERVQFVANRRVEILERGGVGMGAAELVESLGLLGPDSHLAHGVYLGRDGRRIIADSGSVVTLCPRSNVIVGVDAPPIADYLAEDIPFAVGTDSLSSSPSLDPLDDVARLKALALEQGADPSGLDRRLLEAATLGGAQAMGLEHQLGSLTVGKRADFAVFDVNVNDRSDEEVSVKNERGRGYEAAIVDSGAGTCVLTVIGGVERWRRT